MGKQGDLRAEREIGEATHADFFCAIHFFLVSFVLFSPVSFFFFKNKKLSQQLYQDAKKIIFTACHSGKLKLACTSPDVISASPKDVLTSRIDFAVLLLFEFLKKHHLPIGQVKNRIHWPDSKIH